MPYGLGMMGQPGSTRFQVVPSVAPQNGLESAQIGQVLANTGYTNSLTAAQAASNQANTQAAADAAIIQQAAKDHTKWEPKQTNVVPSAPVPAGGPMNPNQPAPPPPSPVPSLGSMLNSPGQAPFQAQGMPNAAQPLLPGAATTAYPPLTPTNGPAVLDHPAVQSVTGAHNNQDTSMAVGSNPTFNPVQSYDAVGPNGQKGQFSLDRAGIIQGLMAQGRGDLANGLVKQWTDADLQSEKTKQQGLVVQHAQLAGKIAAFESLPDSMKPQAYGSLMQEAQAEGINTAGILPATYDPADKTGMAQLKSFEAQASTVADREKAKMDAVVATMEQQRTAETARHNKADEWLTGQKNQIEAAKAAQAANGLAPNSGVVGPAYQALLDAPTINTLKGVATGTLVLPPRGQQTAALLTAAHQAFPDVDIPGAQKLSQELGKVSAGTSGGVAVGSNKTLEHIGVMMGSDQAGGQVNLNFPLGNQVSSLLNAGTNTTNPAANAAKSAWDSAHAATMTEMARSFKGGPPAESEIVRDMKNLTFNDAPAKKLAVYKAFSDLLQGQTGGVESQRKMVYGSLDPGTSLLTSKAQDVYKQLHGGSAPGLLPPFDAAATPGQVTPNSPPAAATPPAPKVGLVSKGYAFQGGDPAKATSWKKVP